MSIRVTCEKCGVVLKVKEDLAGTKCKCPACKGTLLVPTLEQAAQAAPLAATETAAAGETGALKIPTAKTKAAKVAPPADDNSAPSHGANGSPPSQSAAPAAEAHAEQAPAPTAEHRLPDPPPPVSETATDDLSATPPPPPTPKPPAEPKDKPKSERKPRLQMSDTDAEDVAPPAAGKKTKPTEPAAPPAESTPAAETKPAPESKPPAEPKSPAAAAPEAAKSGGDEFDLDSFLMAGPKPKTPPPIPEENAPRKGAPPRGSGRKLSMSDDETNVSGPSETLPPPNRGRGGAAESAMAALTGGGGTASSAKDLLARASQEGRSRASQMPDEKRERFDYAGAFKAIGKEYGLHVVGTVVLCAVLFFGMDYMLGSNLKLPQLGRTTGTVTLKKQPVAGVVVNFTPIVAKENKDGPQFEEGLRTASAVTDAEGRFDLQYMDGIYGAVVGKNRVSIEPYTPENTKKIPGNYQKPETSGDVRDVKATSNEFNIEL